MPSPSNLLQSGVEAIKQKRYSEAVHSLKTFCINHPSQSSKDYFQAQMWLIKAYQESGQLEMAIALCRQMTLSTQPQVQAWAQRILPTLSAEPTQPASASVNEATSMTTPAALSAEQSAEQSAELLKTGNQALKMRKFAEAVAALEAYCQGTPIDAPNYAQGQMWLAKAYKGTEQTEQAIALCQQLLTNDKEYVQIWAKQYLLTLAPVASQEQPKEPLASLNNSSHPASANTRKANAQPTQSPEVAAAIPKAGRSDRRGIKLPMQGVAANLSLASGVTISLLFGMVLVLSLSVMLIVNNDNPTLGLVSAIGITILFNVAVFFIAPFLMDLIQGWVYSTRWTSLAEVERYSPEAASVIREVCRQKNLSHPRLGIIEDSNPTAFTYGSLPNSARLVVSQGLFKYLDDDEVATVYAHELGHIVHWDFAVMTLASTLVQITYLIYIYTREMANRLGNSDIEKKIKGGAQSAALMAYIFYVIGEYLLLYLSRTREYHADHFAAETTGNPNALSRALVKIAYGILEEGKRNPEPSKMIQGTRALGISDPRSAALTGTAYRVASEPQKVGKVFLWDMFNPWAWWMELSSTHPLTGKRVRALSTYAERLGLDVEFNMADVIRMGRSLNKQKLYGSFATDVVMLWADWIGLGVGLLIGIAFLALAGNGKILLSLALVGFGFGSLLKMLFMYPDFNQPPATDVLTLMSDPYASPLRGRPVKLEGEIIGRGNAGSKVGSDLQLQDATGLIFLRYCSRFGPIGNFLFGMTQAEGFIHQQVSAIGWFRRGVMPWVDMTRMDCEQKWTVKSYHRFWLLILSVGSIILGFVLPTLI